jgi:hypothetical protein
MRCRREKYRMDNDPICIVTDPTVCHGFCILSPVLPYFVALDLLRILLDIVSLIIYEYGLLS